MSIPTDEVWHSNFYELYYSLNFLNFFELLFELRNSTEDIGILRDRNSCNFDREMNFYRAIYYNAEGITLCIAYFVLSLKVWIVGPIHCKFT